jgi:hypothetical protein
MEKLTDYAAQFADTSVRCATDTIGYWNAVKRYAGWIDITYNGYVSDILAIEGVVIQHSDESTSLDALKENWQNKVIYVSTHPHSLPVCTTKTRVCHDLYHLRYDLGFSLIDERQVAIHTAIDCLDYYQLTYDESVYLATTIQSDIYGQAYACIVNGKFPQQKIVVQPLLPELQAHINNYYN